MFSLRRLVGRVTPDYGLYLANDVDPDVNERAIARIKISRTALSGIVIDSKLRRSYEREMISTLPGIKFCAPLFGSVRHKAEAALDDRDLSPCAYFSGEQARLQGIPKDKIPHDVRRYTTDVETAVPELLELIDDKLVHAIRSSIGSNFRLTDVTITRNFHVPPELAAKYDLLSDRWHFDAKPLDVFYLFVCLSHVTEADGPTHVMSAPDSRLLLTRGFDCAARDRDQDPYGGLPQHVVDGMPSVTLCVGPPGTMLLSHTSLCLHRAGALEPGHTRDIVVFGFQHSSELEISWDSMRRGRVV